MAERAMRLLDKHLQLVRILTEPEADTLLSSGKVEYRKRGKRGECLVLLCELTVSTFARGSSDSSLGGPAVQSVYRESHRGRSLAMLKRVAETGAEDPDKALDGRGLARWDNSLTFEELRAGQMISQETRERLLNQAWRKKHIVSFLAYEEWQREQPQAA